MGKRKIEAATIKPTALPWHGGKIDPWKFQLITLFTYRELYGDINISEYLRQGQKQEGIDLLTIKKANGKYICIQCKHYLRIKLSEIKTAIEAYLSGNFAGKSERFIISTSASLQDVETLAYLRTQKTFLLETYHIELEWWDVYQLEVHLKEQYRFVEHFFGVDKAEEHCFRPQFSQQKHQDINGFLMRNIEKADEFIEDEIARFYSRRERSSLTLEQLLKYDPINARKICLLGEAYEGKSTLLHQTAFNLSQSGNDTVLLLSLKNATVAPIDELLTLEFDTWKTIPAGSLVILIDGLDEVPADKFLDMVSYIENFARKHSDVRLVFSCRKLFFASYALEQRGDLFERYHLIPLSYAQSYSYLSKNIGDRAEGYLIELNRMGIVSLLATPFYLIKLSSWHKNDQGGLPSNKLAIAERIVEESLELSGSRRLHNGAILKQQRVQYKKLLKALALTLQVQGLNACDDEVIQELFSPEHQQLLSQSTVLSINNDKWSFVNAFFQEQLAALALKNIPITQLEKMITVGRQRKIQTKWLQTISTFISMLDLNDPVRQNLIALIENDNIELFARCEADKFPPAFRHDILLKILRKTVIHNARLTMIDERDLASFVGSDSECTELLITTLTKNIPSITKITCCKTLRHIHLSTKQQNDLAVIAEQQLEITDHAYYGQYLLEAITHCGKGRPAIINLAISRDHLIANHEFRQGIYYMIAKANLIDTYYQFALDGLPVLHAYNKTTLHHGSERRLTELWLSTRNPILIRQLYKMMSGELFQSFFRYRREESSKFIQRLVELTAEIYQEDKLIIFAVMDFLTKSNHIQHDDEFNGIVDFFGKTNSYRLALRIYLHQFQESKRNYVFSDAITSDCFDILIDAVEDGAIGIPLLDSFISGLYTNNKPTEVSRLRQLKFDAFGSPPEEEDKRYARYAQAEYNKQVNDIKYIRSATDFAAGVTSIFHAIGKTSISHHELYQRLDDDDRLIEVNSYFAAYFFGNYWQEDKTLLLEDCLKAIRNRMRFRIWRTSTLLNANRAGEGSKQLQAMLKAYYNRTIKTFRFNAITMDSCYEKKKLASQYLKIWSTHRFSTPDDILLEFPRINEDGIDIMAYAKNNKHYQALTPALLAHFQDKPNILKERILQNLKSGFKNDRVLGTHFAICKELQLSEAMPYILDAIYTGRLSDSCYRLIDIYLELGGKPESLICFFLDYNDLNNYTFLHLTKVLMQEYPNVVKEKLMACFNLAELQPDTRKDMAKYLANLGVSEGFTYLIDLLSIEGEVPYYIQSGSAIWNVETDWGLSVIEPKMEILVNPDAERNRFFESPEAFLWEVLSGFASKSEEDLEKVSNLLDRKYHEFKSRFPHKAGHLTWHAEQMREQFRTSSSTMIPLTELKQHITASLI